MYDIFRHCLIGLLALLFTASGVVARQCAAAHHAAAAAEAATVMIEAEHRTPTSHDHATHDHDGGVVDHQHASNDVVPMAIDDNACNKCCGICTLAVATAPDAGTTAIFTVSPAMFFGSVGHCCDMVPLVDPGIPKRIL